MKIQIKLEGVYTNVLFKIYLCMYNIFMNDVYTCTYMQV